MFVSDETRQAQAQHRALRDLVAQLRPDEVPLREAPALYDEYAAMARLVSGAMTLLADRVAESKVWEREGHRSAADYLAKQNGTAANAARMALTASKRLGSQPQTEAAVRGGELSLEQSDAISAAVAVNPVAESDLLAKAKTSSLSELREECRRRKAAADPDPDETARRLHRERRVRTHTDGEGAWNLFGRGPGLAGARIGKSLDLITDKLFHQARREGRRESRDAYAFDALDTMAACFWDIYHGADPDLTWAGSASPASAESDDGTPAGDTGPDGSARSAGRADSAASGAAGTRPTVVGNDNDTGFAGAVTGRDSKPSRADRDNPRPDGERTDDMSSPSAPDNTRVASSAHSSAGSDRGPDTSGQQQRASRQRRPPALKDLSLVHVDLAAFLRGHLLDGEVCEVPGGAPLTITDVRGLLADAVVKVVVTDRTEVVNVTSLGTGVRFLDLVPGAQKPRSRQRPLTPRYLVFIRVDAVALRADLSNDPGIGLPVPGVGPVTQTAAYRLLPEWVVDRMATRGVDVRVPQHGRGLNTPQLVAALWSQPLCSVEGCNRYRVEYDHRHPWATVHETCLANIDPLCAHHHRLKSEKNWALVPGTGKRPMVPPTNPRHPDHNPTARRPQEAPSTTPSPASPATPTAPPRDPAHSATSTEPRDPTQLATSAA